MSSNPPQSLQPPLSILFVCLGNICRSPMAHGVFTSLTAHPPYTNTSNPLIFRIDSCGTGAYHVGSTPDSRTLATLSKNKIKFTHCARKLHMNDFSNFDFIFCMDDDNLADVKAVQKLAMKRKSSHGDDDDDDDEGKKARVMMWGEFARERKLEDVLQGRGIGEGRVEEVEDPYYGGGEGFEIAYEQCVRFTRNFLECVFPGVERR